MKKIILSACVVVSAIAAAPVFAYDSQSESADIKLPPGHPPVSGMGAHGPGAPQAGGPVFVGTVAEVIDVSGYTYVKIDGDGASIWAVTTTFKAEAGMRVEVPAGMVMKNFESPTLGRTFEQIHFVDSIKVLDDAASGESTVAEPAEKVALPAGAISVADLYGRAAELEGQEVTVRGRVVRYNEKVMGSNWLHIDDGTTSGKATDITVSTTDAASKDAVVTARGVVAVNVDLGYGYFYPVMIKEARITAE